jgi:hypothetical protein
MTNPLVAVRGLIGSRTGATTVAPTIVDSNPRVVIRRSLRCELAQYTGIVAPHGFRCHTDGPDADTWTAVHRSRSGLSDHPDKPNG